jgi:hypothetical protein
MTKRIYLAGLLAITCGHGAKPASLPAPLAPTDVPGAQAAATDKCAGVSDDRHHVDECCAALSRVGDAFLASGKKQAAYDSYEETRQQCPRFHPVRRQLFLVRQATAPDASAARSDVWYDTDVDVQLGDDIEVVAFSSYIDGEPLSTGRKGATPLAPGAHELAMEVYLAPTLASTLGGPIRMDVRTPIILPKPIAGEPALSGHTLVRLHDAGGQGTIGERVTSDTLVTQIAAPDTGPNGPVMLAPNVGTGLRLTDVNKSPHTPRLPRRLSRAGMTLWGLYKVCVDVDGAVTWVNTMKSADTIAVDARWKTAIRTWRYRPHQVDGKPRPFCTPARVQVTAD